MVKEAGEEKTKEKRENIEVIVTLYKDRLQELIERRVKEDLELQDKVSEMQIDESRMNGLMEEIKEAEEKVVITQRTSMRVKWTRQLKSREL